MFATLLWVFVAVVALVAELATGTLYLLVLGAAAGVTAAYAASAPYAWGEMLVVFALSCVLGYAVLRRRKRTESPQVVSDEGAEVTVLQSLGEGRYRVRYRGTEWDAVVPQADAHPAHATQLRVVRVEGIALICEYA